MRESVSETPSPTRTMVYFGGQGWTGAGGTTWAGTTWACKKRCESKALLGLASVRSAVKHPLRVRVVLVVLVPRQRDATQVQRSAFHGAARELPQGPRVNRACRTNVRHKIWQNMAFEPQTLWHIWAQSPDRTPRGPRLGAPGGPRGACLGTSVRQICARDMFCAKLCPIKRGGRGIRKTSEF